MGWGLPTNKKDCYPRANNQGGSLCHTQDSMLAIIKGAILDAMVAGHNGLVALCCWMQACIGSNRLGDLGRRRTSHRVVRETWALGSDQHQTQIARMFGPPSPTPTPNAVTCTTNHVNPNFGPRTKPKTRNFCTSIWRENTCGDRQLPQSPKEGLQFSDEQPYPPPHRPQIWLTAPPPLTPLG